MAKGSEKTRITIEGTGDDQYEAIVQFENGHKVSKVFPTHDEAYEWAEQQNVPDPVETAPEDRQEDDTDAAPEGK